jgi:hypothetical protein
MIRRSLSLVALMVFAQFALLLSPMITRSASAASEHPQDQLERWLFYRGMRACLEDPYFGTGLTDGNDNEKISAGDVNAGKLQIRDKKEGFGYLGPGLDGADDNDGTVKCETPAIFSQGASKFGFSNVVDLICEMNRALSKDDNDRIEPSNAADCEKSSSFEFNGGGGSVFQRALTKALEEGGSKDRPDIDINDNGGGAYTHQALLYLIGSNSLSIFCGNGVSLEDGAADGGDINNDDVVSVDVVKADGTVAPSQPYALGDDERDENSKVDDVYYNQGGNTNEAQDLRCHEMAQMTRDNSAAYAAWKKLNQDVDPGGNEGSEGGEEAAYETSCAIDGIGWIVCPVMIFVGKMNDAAFGFLEEILGIRPAVVTSESTQAAWAAFRDIANVAFVIAFMVIVYSQITSAGVSNYGIKKMLPRIVIAAILVNISFIICAIAVDLSNIVGASVYSLFQNSIAPDVGSDITNASWEETIAGAVALATAIGVILIVVLFFIGPMALLALGMIILILVARQALVILLIVMAPLAFVAYLLPNTEDWFKKWYKAFIAVLMVYPIVGAVFGVSTLASRVLSSVAADTEDSSLLQVIALGVLAVPLFAVPAILKGSLSAAGSIGARISNLADKTQGKATQRGKERFNESAAGQYMAYRGQEGQRKRALARSGKAVGSNKNPLNWRRNATAAAMGRFNASSASGAFGDRLAAGGADLEDKMWDEEVGRQKKLITVGNNMTNEAILSDLASGKGSAEYQAALGSVIMQRNHRESHLKALEIVRARQEAASLKGDSAEKGTVAGIQKQMLHDGGSNMPWAVGDQARGAMENGNWGGIDESGNAQAGHGVTLNEQMQERVGTHMSVEKLASMNPDELKSVHKMAKNGQLNPQQLAALQGAITKLRTDEQYKGSEKPNASPLYDEILGTLPYSVDPTTGKSTRYNEDSVF